MSLLRHPVGRERSDYDDLLAPPGYRFLVQSRDCATEQEFRHWLLATFGPAKAIAAKIVEGFSDNQIDAHVRRKVKTAFRAYLPRR